MFTSFTSSSLEYLKNGRGRELLLLKLSTSSVKILHSPVPFLSSHIWLFLFTHHFSSAVKPLKNLLLEVLVKYTTSSPALTHSHASIKLKAPDSGERLPKWAASYVLLNLILHPTQSLFLLICPAPFY